MRRISWPHLEAQLGVEVRERLVHQHERRRGRRWRGRWRRAAAGRPRAGPAACAPWPSSRTRPDRLVDPRCGLGLRHAAAWRGRSRHCRARSCAGRARSSGTPCRSRARSGRRLSMRRSSSQMAPSVSGSRPAMQLSAVDLPQPEGPSRAMNSPRADRERHAAQRVQLAEVAADARRAAARGSRPRRGPARGGRPCRTSLLRLLGADLLVPASERRDHRLRLERQLDRDRRRSAARTRAGRTP